CMERMTEIVKGGAAILFVSHNLSAVATLCTRALLLENGCISSEGLPQEVIQTYLGRAHVPRTDPTTKDVFIVNLVVRGRSGRASHCEAGDEAWVDIDVKANRPCKHLSLTLYLRDHKNYNVFDTATERLGVPRFSLEAGETSRFTFRL